MKLRNKKSGEIGNLQPYGDDGRIWVWIGNMSKPEYRYNSLAELNEEWEDYYEETKGYWYYDTTANRPDFIEKCNVAKEDKKLDEQIGNYFETKEEAEKAVEKLKAWRRLKEKGFKFEWWTSESCGNHIEFYIDSMEWDNQVNEDLDLLFGGEE